ncbi:YHS domain-containing (seleno)protein [Flagellimonas flava]|uniref:YHS domain-containing protein n=1 Tax=Flagellimonas flava TaxID=570519 RepID=A0A1M5N9L5_9FLAO|nr:YHS domain-containing (seleno)protein [Allomuricauda flava]SHG85889.1 hypothetical protein SAMN04488116_2720 [Allomuricauda flava]
MKKIILLAFLLLGTIAYSQSKHFNTKKGYAAHGYDVVAYFDGSATLGNKDIGTTFQGIDYKFSTKENLERFNTDPAAYVPQYGGYCAYAIAVSGKKVNVNPETYEIRDGKLYLFYNAGKTNTLDLWLKESPETLQLTADKNWKKIAGK